MSYEIIYLSHLVFAQRAAPGVGYQLPDLRETLGNSIRGARYHFRKKNGNIADAAAFLDKDNVNGSDYSREQNTSHDNPTDVVVNMNENNGECI